AALRSKSGSSDCMNRSKRCGLLAGGATRTRDNVVIDVEQARLFPRAPMGAAVPWTLPRPLKNPGLYLSVELFRWPRMMPVAGANDAGRGGCPGGWPGTAAASD